MAKNSFTNNALKLMMGTSIAQAVPILISPILTQLYLPEDFGVFALFLSLVTILGSIVSGRYEMAILLPKINKNALNIAILGCLVSLVIAFIWLIIVISFSKHISQWLGNDTLRFWLYLSPIPIFFTGIFNVLTNFSIRAKKYKQVSLITIYKSFLNGLMQLIFGCLNFTNIGLILSSIISQTYVGIKLFKISLLSQVLRNDISYKRILACLIKYKKFPFYSMPGVLINSVAQNILPIFIAYNYSLTEVGYYALVQRLFGVTSTVLSRPLSQVYFQEAAEERKRTGKAIKSYKFLIKRLVLILLPVSIIFFFTINNLIVLVFGKDWVISGIYAKILMPYFVFRFISSPLTLTGSVFQKQKISLIVNLIIFVVTITSFFLCKLFNFSIYELLRTISIGMSISYLSFIYLYWKIANGKI